MGCSMSAATMVTPETHELTSKPTGTLIFAAKDRENYKANVRRQSVGAAPSDSFGLHVNYADIERGDRIGRGSYGAVYKAKYKGKRIALKELFIPEHPADKEEMLTDFARECEILGLLHHPNIVVFLGAVQSEPNYCLLTILYPGSVASLLKMAKKKTIVVTWKLLIGIAKDAAKACAYLHGLEPQILHRDLKAENLLTDENFRGMLSDFGLSRSVQKSDQKGAMMTFCGSPSWVAPEIFRGDAYNEKVDVYSYGVVLWELFNFEKPYANVSALELPFLVGKGGLRPEPRKHIPKYLNEIMEKCWEEKADDRPQFTEIFELFSKCADHFDVSEAVNKGHKAGPDLTEVAATEGTAAGGDGGDKTNKVAPAEGTG